MKRRMIAVLITTWILGSMLLLVAVFAYSLLEDRFPRFFAWLWGETEHRFDFDAAERQLAGIPEPDLDRADGRTLT